MSFFSLTCIARRTDRKEEDGEEGGDPVMILGIARWQLVKSDYSHGRTIV
jgi:hypothetical protein